MSNIRQLTKDDVYAYKEIRLESLQKVPDAFGSSYEEELKEKEKFFIDRIEGGHVFGGFAGEDLVGVSGYFQDKHQKSKHVAGIWGVYVRETHRGQGICGQIFEEILKNMPNEIEQIRLGVGKHNEAAKNFYKKMGFEECGLEERVLKIDNQYYDELLMVKFLK